MLSRLMPLGASAVVHLGIVLVVGGHQPKGGYQPVAAARPDVVSDVPVEIMASAVAEPVSTLPAGGNVSVTHLARSSAVRSRPSHASSPANTPNAPNANRAPHETAAAPSEVARFTRRALEAPASGSADAPSARAELAGSAANNAHGANGTVDEVVADSGVSTHARLISGSPSFYPSQAREAEIEADVPLEIIVDQRGWVTAARAIQHVGYGLDDAAIRSVRAYRFSPALRGGHPVHVKMRWVVQFRLR